MVARDRHEKGYQVQTDGIDKEQWSNFLSEFDDATIYQTSSFGALGAPRCSGRDVAHVVLRIDNEIVSICQLCIRGFPLLGTGIAEVEWGPLWRKKGGTPRFEGFHHMVGVLKEEFAVKRSLMLTISPYARDGADSRIRFSLHEHGFQLDSTVGAYQTLRLDLSQSLEELRTKLSPEWRRNLNRAARNNLRLVEGESDDLYEVFLQLQKEMLRRKKYVPGVNYERFRMIQRDLRADLKMKIMVCEFEREPICAAICSAIGDTGIYLFGATGDRGLKLNGSYLLQWRIIEWLKERNYRWYDLGGVDPIGDPSVYHFKKGIAGKDGQVERFIGGYYYCAHLRSHLLHVIRQTKKRLKKRKRRKLRRAAR